jgi:hypothetical protein
MWEAYGMENQELLWAGATLRGGIAGEQRATCGALTAAAVSLGLRHISPADDKEKAGKEREAAVGEAGELVRDFIVQFGGVACLDLVGVDLSERAAFEQARATGLLDRTCHVFIPFIIGKLYELEEKREQQN